MNGVYWVANRMNDSLSNPATLVLWTVRLGMQCTNNEYTLTWRHIWSGWFATSVVWLF